MDDESLFCLHLEEDYMREDIPRHKIMPLCVWRPLQHIRIYRETSCNGAITEDTLEMLYEDGNGTLFWGPVPIVTQNNEQG